MEEILRGVTEKGWFDKKNLLTLVELRTISHFFEQKKKDFKPAYIGKGENRKREIGIRGDFTFWLDPLNPAIEFKKIIDFLNELRTGLNQTLFVGLKEFECHLALYPEGTYYKRHSDRFGTDSSRSLSFVFYLHEEWRKGDGGELVLYGNKKEILQEIDPLPGRFICFLSEEFPHEVKTSYKERRSLTGLMHTKIIN